MNFRFFKPNNFYRCINNSSYGLINSYNVYKPKNGFNSIYASKISKCSLNTYFTPKSTKYCTSFSLNNNTQSPNNFFKSKHHLYSLNSYRNSIDFDDKYRHTYGLSQHRAISTLKRRKFKIKKHKKKKRKKKWSRMKTVTWRSPADFKQLFRSPAKVRRIVKEHRARNKGNRTLRIPRQR